MCSRTCEVLPPRRADRLGDAEVGDDRMATRQKNVLGLDVAMQNTAAVAVVECICYLGGDLKRSVDR